MATHAGGVAAMTGCPIRADMATVINTPNGVAESGVLHGNRGSPTGPSAHQLEKRKNLRKMLSRRLQQEHGSDPVKTALINGELDTFEPLQNGAALSPGHLAELERNVKKAVAAADGDPRSLLPAQTWPRPARKVDYAQDLSRVSDWTAVAQHRAGFYLVEQQREAAEKQRRKEQLAVQLAHQRSEHEARKRDRKMEIAREAAQLEALENEYKAEEAATAAKRKAKMGRELEARRSQIEQREARASVGLRLRQLEDQQVLNEIRNEQRRTEEAMRRKAVEVAEQNERTERENEANQQRKRALLKAQWEEELRLNRELEELLDKQERDRAALGAEGLKQLKARIASQQRAYEDKAGAADKQRAEAEEVNRQRWEEKYESEQREREKARAEKRLQGLADQTRSLEEQIALHGAAQQRVEAALLEAKRAAQLEDAKNAAEIRREAEAFAASERQKRIDHLAMELKNQQTLASQIAEHQALNRPGRAPMSMLEVTLNRELLASMVAGKPYEPHSILD